VIELPELMLKEAEHTRELAKLIQAPSETEKMSAELAFMRAKHCSWRSKQTRELPKPTREPLKQRFELPEHFLRLAEQSSRRLHALHNKGISVTTDPRVEACRLGRPAG
jgi:hypothetical protein